MKKIISLIFALTVVFSMFGQAPEKLSYQSIIRNSSSQILANQPVGIQISVLQQASNGNAVYIETHNTTTNSSGLISLEIGNGTPIMGNFSTINWSANVYFIKTEIDPTGGNSFSITSTSQVLSVPYALHAKTAESINGSLNITSISGLQDELDLKLESEIDGSITNEIELPTGGTDGQILKTDGSGNYTWIDQNTSTDTNTQLNEAEVDAFVANNGFLTTVTDSDITGTLDINKITNLQTTLNAKIETEIDGSITNEIELPAGGTDGQVLKTDGAGNYAWIDLPAGNSTPNVISINADFTVSSGGTIFITGEHIVTLPQTPNDGMELIICTADRNASIDLNGKSFRSGGNDFAGPFTFATLNKDLVLIVYSAAIDRWFLN